MYNSPGMAEAVCSPPSVHQWQHTCHRSGQKLCVAGQHHGQVKDVPGLHQVGSEAAAGQHPQDELHTEAGVEGQVCSNQMLHSNVEIRTQANVQQTAWDMTQI